MECGFKHERMGDHVSLMQAQDKQIQLLRFMLAMAVLSPEVQHSVGPMAKLNDRCVRRVFVRSRGGIKRARRKIFKHDRGKSHQYAL